MKTVLFVPGFYEDSSNRDYDSVLQVFEKVGYETKLVTINWRRTSLDHWLKEFSKTYQKYDPEEVVLGGFSFGAVVVFAAAAERNPAALWLCSLSPYFEGDNPKPSWLKFIGRRRAEAFAKVDFPKLASQVKCPTTILYGADESQGIIHRAKEANRLIKHSKLVAVPDTKHKVEAEQYLVAIDDSLVE